MEMYCSVSARILGYVQRVGIGNDEEYFLPLRDIYNISKYASWPDAFSNLKRLIDRIFRQVDTFIESKNEDVVNRVKRYIRHNLDGDVSLYNLSTTVHLCPEHLLRVFKKQEGVTIRQYVIDLKLTRAKQLLAGSDAHIKDIATELGFTSTGYFSQFFKSKTGLTPNAYRDDPGGKQ